jgi:hypothetical protein
MSPYDTYNTDEDLLHDVRWVSNLTQEGTDAQSSIAYEDKENAARTSDVPGVSKTSTELRRTTDVQPIDPLDVPLYQQTSTEKQPKLHLHQCGAQA